jgi:alpha/beta superfamily hydrolase
MTVKMEKIKEQTVFFGKNPKLEGRYADAGTQRGAVICHPHPLMGGDMNNSAVRIIAESLQISKIATLRFNFRGVGKSEGLFDEGKGETEDIAAAASFLKEKTIQDILLVGYSFGAWVSSRALPKLNLRKTVLIAPPLELFPFDFSILRGKVGLMVSADGDPYCPVKKITKAADDLTCPLIIIPDTDHFFFGKENALAASISSYVNKPQ